MAVNTSIGAYCLILISLSFAATASAQLPTLYEYYSEGGIGTGLETYPGQFKLNGKDITLYSGSIHYFRVVPEYWRDRLRRLRAAGLNTIDTYVPWNLHEPQMGEFDFGDKDNDFSKLLNIRQFMQIAQEEDLFVILRPGPYICSEWEFGGMPSWLLRYPDIKVRTSDPIFTNHVKQYFDQLLAQVVDLQFTRGGSIIAVQIENEYGSFGPYDEIKDREYLSFIRDTYVDNGISELLLTCDSPVLSGDTGALPGYLQTANFDNNPGAQFDRLLELQPDKPLMAMEYWSGWFDYWFGVHTGGLSPEAFGRHLETIFSYNASVNFYMFHGGSTYGFLNGANRIPVFPFYASDVSSYDYGAPLSEAGDYTEKYQITKDLIAADNKVQTFIPEAPAENPKVAYPSVPIAEYLTYDQIIAQIPPELVTEIESVTNMEALDINNGNGQSYGLIVYRKQLDLSTSAELEIAGHIRDAAMVIVDNVQKTTKPEGSSALLNFGFWTINNSNFTIEDSSPGMNTLDIVVENWGRVNFGGPKYFEQQKGLFEGPVSVDGIELNQLTAIPIELKSKWIQNLAGWNTFEPGPILSGPVMVRTTFTIEGEPQDTFINMQNWGRGSLFVNGLHMGRYFHVGPQITSYIPAPLLRQGVNEVIIFEHYMAAEEIVFSDTPILNS